MITPTEIRAVSNNATVALAGLIPFVRGSGRDSHGNPVPNAGRVVEDALRRLVQAGRTAEAILAASGHEEIHR